MPRTNHRSPWPTRLPIKWAARSARRAADKIRTADQFENGEADRPDDSPVCGKGFEFEHHGAESLKGFDEPVSLYEVRVGR